MNICILSNVDCFKIDINMKQHIFLIFETNILLMNTFSIECIQENKTQKQINYKVNKKKKKSENKTKQKYDINK